MAGKLHIGISGWRCDHWRRYSTYMKKRTDSKLPVTNFAMGFRRSG